MKNKLIKILNNPKNQTNERCVINNYAIKNDVITRKVTNFYTNGNILGVFEDGEIKYSAKLLKDIEYEYIQKGFEGIFVDASNAQSSAFIYELDKLCYKRKIELYVPLEYEKSAENAKLVFKTEITGGDLSNILQYKKMQFGERLVTLVRKIQREFSIPNQNDTYIDVEKLDTTGRNVFFSENLYTNYFTYMKNENTCVFTMFDDENSIEKKIELCKRCSILEVFVDET